MGDGRGAGSGLRNEFTLAKALAGVVFGIASTILASAGSVIWKRAGLASAIWPFGVVIGLAATCLFLLVLLVVFRGRRSTAVPVLADPHGDLSAKKQVPIGAGERSGNAASRPADGNRQR